MFDTVNDGLDIPDFLRRSRGDVKRTRKSPRRKYKPARPDGERWANAERWLLHLHDELPDIGTGYRHVWVSTGRKWAFIANAHGRAKITVAAWNQLSKHGWRIDL